MIHYDTDPQSGCPIAKYEGGKWDCDNTTRRTFKAAKKYAIKIAKFQIAELQLKLNALERMQESDCQIQRNPFA